MRVLLLAAAVALPAALSAQYPGPGNYKLIVRPAGSTQEIPLSFKVSMVGDSTAMELAQGENKIPIAERGPITGGFFFTFGNVRCPFVTIEDHWEAICADPFDNPLYTFSFPKKPEPDSTKG